MKRKTIKYNNKNLYKEQIAHIKGYYIDKQGDVYYRNRRRIPTIYSNGYKKIRIRINGLGYNLKYHRLQAYQKYGDKIYKKGIVVRHLDNNPSNNSFSNISIGTSSQNFHDSLPETIQQRAQKGGDSNRKYNHVNIIGLRTIGMTYKQISNMCGLSKGHISWIINHSTESKSKNN